MVCTQSAQSKYHFLCVLICAALLLPSFRQRNTAHELISIFYTYKLSVDRVENETQERREEKSEHLKFSHFTSYTRSFSPAWATANNNNNASVDFIPNFFSALLCVFSHSIHFLHSSSHIFMLFFLFSFLSLSLCDYRIHIYIY